MRRPNVAFPALPIANRLPDWEQRLLAYLASVSSRPHEYGAHDCMLFAPGGAATAVNGADLGTAHHGKYQTAAGAVRYLKHLGFDSPEEWIDAHFVTTPIGFAQRGDIVLVPAQPGGGHDPAIAPRWNVPAVCVGDVALAAGDHGLVPVPRSHWLKAWSVGR